MSTWQQSGGAQHWSSDSPNLALGKSLTTCGLSILPPLLLEMYSRPSFFEQSLGHPTRELMSQHLDVAIVERAATHQSTCCKAMIISSLKLLSPKGLANAWLHTPYIFDAHCDDVALKDTSNALSTRKTARTRGHADRLESHQHDLSGG